MILPIENYNIEVLKKAIGQATKFSPQTNNFDIGDFIQTLVQTKARKPVSKVTALQESGIILRHVFHSFVTVCPVYAFMHLATVCSLALMPLHSDEVNVFSVISGNLYDWRAMIIESCTIHANEELRLFGNEFYNYFSSIGLEPIFSNYRRRGVKSGSGFYLEQK